MKLRNLLFACCLLMFTDSVIAQSAGAAGDPISGTWTGHMGQNETLLSPIVLELKVDSKAAISGTITGPPNPGEIKAGTFDPKTGALKLEVNVKDSANTVAVFEGTVVQGTAIGRVSLGNQAGYFKITKSGGGAAAAQEPSGNDAKALLPKGFSEVSGWVTKAADLVPAEKYTYRPAPTVRTFGQLIAHIADSYNYFCAAAGGGKVQWSDAIEKGNTDKATLVQKLKQSTDACNATYGGAGQFGPLMANIAHTNLHYGNIITYMRMMGQTPPSS